MKDSDRVALKQQLRAGCLPLCAGIALMPQAGQAELPPAECETRRTVTTIDPQTEGTIITEEGEACPSQAGEVSGTLVREFAINLLDRIARQRGVLRGSPGEPETASLGQALGGAAGGGDSIGEDSRASVFLLDNYAESERDETDSGRGFEQDSNSAVLGLDYRVDPSLFVGGTLTYLRGDTDIDDDAGSTETEGAILGLHSSRYWDSGVFLDTLVTYADLSVGLDRSDGTNRYTADTDSRQRTLDVSLGYQYSNARWRVTPIAKLFHLRGYLEGYSESVTAAPAGGTPAPAPETVDRQAIDSNTAELSVQTEYVMLADWGVWVPSLKLAYQHEFADGNTISGARGAGAPAQAFAQEGEDPDDSVFTATLGVAAQFQRGWSAFLVYEYLEHDFLDNDSVAIGVRYELPDSTYRSLPSAGPRR